MHRYQVRCDSALGGDAETAGSPDRDAAIRIAECWVLDSHSYEFVLVYDCENEDIIFLKKGEIR